MVPGARWVVIGPLPFEDGGDDDDDAESGGANVITNSAFFSCLRISSSLMGMGFLEASSWTQLIDMATGECGGGWGGSSHGEALFGNTACTSEDMHVETILCACFDAEMTTDVYALLRLPRLRMIAIVNC